MTGKPSLLDMHIKAKDIALLLDGVIEGNPDVEVFKPAPIEDGAPGAISFLANPKYIEYAYTTKSSVLLVSNEFQPVTPIEPTLIRVGDVYSSLSKLLNHFQDALNASDKHNEVHELAFVHPSAELGDNVSIAPFVYVGPKVKIADNCVVESHVHLGEGVEVGEGSHLHSGVKVYKSCVIGAYCILHANAVIGSDGFGFAPAEDGTFMKIPQLGNVVLGDHVEVGANTVIDRATMGSTIIGRGVKLDNLIQIAHNVVIGEGTAIAAQTGIAGSTKIGRHCLIGGQVGFVGHIEIADFTKVQAQSGINKSIKEPGTAVYGSPAMPYNEFLRSYAMFRKLPELVQRLAVVERKG